MRAGRTRAGRVRNESDHLPVEVRERVKHLIAGDGIGRACPCGGDGACGVIAIFRRRCHHGARGIVNRARRLAFGPVDRAVGGCIGARSAGPFPKSHAVAWRDEMEL